MSESRLGQSDLNVWLYFNKTTKMLHLHVFFFFSALCLFFSRFLMSLGSFCRLCRLKRRLKQDRIMQVGGGGVKYPSVGLLQWPSALEIEHQGRDVCERSHESGMGILCHQFKREFNVWDFIRTQRLLWTQGKVWDERVSGSVKRTVEISMFRSAFRAHPASKRPEMIFFSFFLHNLI